MRQRSNRTALRKALARCGCDCDDWDAVSITDCQLARKDIEQIVGVAVAQQVTGEGPPEGMEVEEGAAKEAAPAPGAAAEMAAPAEGAAAAADASAVVALERSGSVAAAGEPAAASAPAPPPGGAAPAAPREQQPAAAAAAEQPCAMQTDEPEAAAAAAAAPPNASTAAVGPGPAGDGDGTVAAPEKVVPLWTLRAAYIMAAAEAIRNVQAEAAAVPEKHALRDVAVDQYEKQLLSEVCAACWLTAGQQVQEAGRGAAHGRACMPAACPTGQPNPAASTHPCPALLRLVISCAPSCLPPAAQIIPPEEIAVGFDDIGALDAVKSTLHEVRRRWQLCLAGCAELDAQVGAGKAGSAGAAAACQSRGCWSACLPVCCRGLPATTAPSVVRFAGRHPAAAAPGAVHPRLPHQAHQG